MEVTQPAKIKNKALIVFDLDGTLAPTKSTIDKEMGELILSLLEIKRVAVIGGGKLELFEHQLLNELNIGETLLEKLFLFPVTATTFYKYKKGWKKIYEHNLSDTEVENIMSAFEKVYRKISYKDPAKTYGKVIENRGSQVTWSALGQDVVKILGEKGIRLKNKWRDNNTPLKLKIAKYLQEYLPNLEVHAAGYTSIDVTKRGIDKAYGLKQMEEYLKIKIEEMLFVGDAIFPGGNDYAITKTPIDYISVTNPDDTKKVIRLLINSTS